VPIAALIFCSATVIADPIPVQRGSNPHTAMLPDHFGLGLRSTQAEISWMTGSGISWDYRYQYINPGWKDWNSPSGQFAYNYTLDSVNAGYIPVFDWYIASGSGTVFSNLASAGYMNTYYSDFVLLLQKIKAATTASPVIVHVEPDLWGFMMQQNGWNPVSTAVAVASSGYAGVSGFANNAPGFAQALIHLRDTYAPNVALAWHASMWGPNNGYSPTRANPPDYQSPTNTGTPVGDFYNALHASFDVIFHDTSDMDSGFYVSNCNTSQNIQRGWWDDAAFANFRQYLNAIYQTTGVSGLLWQTPEGNTLYLSDNNTSYHYQDNRAQYFLQSGNRQHILDYAAAGITDILFGLGQQTPYSQCNSSKSATDHMDYANDGATNPAAINGNMLVASYPDDDGGFLRSAAAAYYGDVLALAPPSVSLIASPTRIKSGNSATLSWNSNNATDCSGGGFDASGASGSAAVSPKTTSTYLITCIGAGGKATGSATVTVHP
jgi:hypothetical protein